MSRSRGSRTLCVVAGLAIVVAGCGSGEPTTQPRRTHKPDPEIVQAPSEKLVPYYNQEIEWTGCGDDLECATIMVPLNYDKPVGDRIEVAVNRLPASDEEQRIGSLVLNPGGPGLSGLQTVRQAKQLFGEGIRKRFDVVGFDPRGVGESTPVRCLDDDEKDEFLSDQSTAISSDDLDEAQKLHERFVEACEENSGDLLPHIGTVNVARDLDVLRGALRDRDLTYVGYSYGSQLGATYADLFPERVRAMVLDGAVDPAADPLEMVVEQAKGSERALRAFVDDCLATEDCPLEATTPEAAMDEITELWTQADEEPLTSSIDPDRDVTGAWVAAGIRFALYSEREWPTLQLALQEAIVEGDGTAFQQLADPYLGRAPDGTWNNSIDAGVAIGCADRPAIDQADAEAAAAEAEETAARFGTDIEWSWLNCEGWPVDPATQEAPAAEGSDPILVIGTKRDPATPYGWATALADELDNATLLTYDGDGHGAYRLSGSECVDDIVFTYVIDGELPADGTHCRPAAAE